MRKKTRKNIVNFSNAEMGALEKWKNFSFRGLLLSVKSSVTVSVCVRCMCKSNKYNTEYVQIKDKQINTKKKQLTNNCGDKGL